MTDLKTVDDGKPEVKDDTELRTKVKTLRLQVEEGYWDLSQALHEVHSNSSYVAWGYDSWKEYVESEELDFQLRKAQYLVSISAWFSKLNKGVQKWVSALGWSRAKELVGRVTNENAAEWKKKIADKTVVQIQAMLKGEEESDSGGEGGEGGDGEGGESDKPSRWAFSLFSGQRETIESALDLAKKSSQSDKEGNNLTLICTEYMASNAAVESADDYLSQVEKVLGVKLIAYQPSSESVVFGSDLMDDLFPESDSPAKPESDSPAKPDGE